MLPFDLHVLSLPLAFILSQDQTLHSLFPELLKKSSYLFKTCVILILFLPVVSMIVFPSFYFRSNNPFVIFPSVRGRKDSPLFI